MFVEVLSEAASKNVNPIDFFALTCYTVHKLIMKEAAIMMNNKFYFYYFKKGCPSYVMSKD